MRMINKSHLTKNNVHLIREKYTTMTCSTCVYKNEDIKGSHVYDCT